MPFGRFYKTLFIPGLEGQYKVWKSDYSSLANKVDEIIQFGNLIGCYDIVSDRENLGPNLTVLNMIALWRSTFPNWTQLVGPNEIMALNFPDKWTNKKSGAILRNKWFTDKKSDQFLVASVNKKRLLTHGGLTYGEWVSLGKPTTAEETASLLHEKYYSKLHLGRCFKLNGKPSFSANPVFADPLRETYISWVTAPEALPFDQVHSAGGMNTYEGRAGISSSLSLLPYIDRVNHTRYGSIVEINGQTLTSVHEEYDRREKIIPSVPRPWRHYVEKIPVVDTRDDLFTGPDYDPNNLSKHKPSNLPDSPSARALYKD